MTEKEVFDTGSQRDSREGKGRLDLLPPLAILRVAKVYEEGAKRYGDRNWELGQPQARFMDSALRHLFQWQAGKRDEDHLGHAAFNILAMIHFDEKEATDKSEFRGYRVVFNSEGDQSSDPYGVRGLGLKSYTDIIPLWERECEDKKRARESG